MVLPSSSPPPPNTPSLPLNSQPTTEMYRRAVDVDFGHSKVGCPPVGLPVFCLC
jgi:hypothetical protein